jgi:cytochrome c553
MTMFRSTLILRPARTLLTGTCTLLALGLAAGRTTTVFGAENPGLPQNVQDKIHAAPLAPGPDHTQDPVKFFDEKVRPVLVENCYRCHTSEAKGGLRMDSHDALLQGGDSGPAVVPGDPNRSLLIAAILQKGDLIMPPKHKLSDSEIATLTQWVKAGAIYDPAEASKPIVPLPTAAAVKGGEGDEFFETNVRPVLVTKCGSCHEDHADGNLRVDSRAALLKGGNSGPAITVGDPDKSLLITAVHGDGSLKMPPDGPHLSVKEIDDLSAWIKMGAPWPAVAIAVNKPVTSMKITDENRAWWSFQPLHAPTIPTASKDPSTANWAKGDIDRLVLAKMESKGLKPAAPADRRTLIRRATLDLTGLPPTEQEVKDFQDDKSPNAYEKVVDRLLASPRYGERWGRHWLDVARYADDDIRGLDPRGRGYMPMDGAWVYRDWVIKAVNDDVPYDQFVTMQLAGDLMSKKPTPEQLEATSFLGGAPWIWDQAEPNQGRADERNERIDAVTRGYLGLTVACARCHDHKYDPVSTKDYYALGGIFASSDYREYPLVPDSEVAYWKDRFTHAEKVDEQLQMANKNAGELVSKAFAAQTSAYMVAAWQVSGKPKGKVEDVADRAKLDPEQLERWVKFLARKQNFYPYLKDWQLMIAQGGTQDQAKYLADAFQKIVEDLQIEEAQLEEDNKKIIAKADVPIRRKKDAKPNEFNTYDEFCPGCTLELKVMPAEKANLYTDLFVRALSSGDEMAAGRGEPGLFAYRGWGLLRRLGPVESQYINDLTAESRKLHADMPDQYPFIHGFTDKPKTGDIPVDVRGNPNQHGPTVQRAFLTVLSPADPKPYTQGSGRLQLAQDIVASPLASRVFVNRVWKWHFGTGIVNSADNFGKVGDPPSDPELLDYLALRLKSDGMSVKKLQREIMLSATYQQSSRESKEAHEVDPNNRLYSHFSLQRLDAEQLRDSILFAAGDLDTSKMGGPAKELGTDNLRRTVYAKVSRFRIDPFLQAFDFPNPTFTAEQRFSTNVPVQRLYFMNNAFVYSQAEKFADRVFPKGDDTARINEAYLILFNRAPTPQELQVGLEFLKTTPEKPGYLVNQQPITAWKEYARVLFSSNEFEFLN